MNVEELYSIIIQRLKEKPKNSFVATLSKNGEDAILQKVGEEATEAIIAAKGKNNRRIIEEIADLYFMTLILLAYKKIPINKIFEELERRHKKQNRIIGRS